MKLSTRCALLACLLLPSASCAVVAGAGAAYVINEEYLNDGFHETRLQVDVEDAWAAAREGMSILSTTADPQVTQEPRRITGEYRRLGITVEVQAVDLDESLLRVQAKQVIGYNEDVAREVSDYIVGRLSETR